MAPLVALVVLEFLRFSVEEVQEEWRYDGRVVEGVIVAGWRR